jgi:Methyltransferase domain
MTQTELSAAAMPESVYVNGEHLEKNPDWHVYASSWKAKHVLRMLKRHQIAPQTIGEVGCGAGEVLRQLQLSMDPNCVFSGYDISPQAIELARSRENQRLHCKLADILQEPHAYFDLLLILDVVEHVEDYFAFLRDLQSLARDKIFNFPLDLSVQSLVRSDGLMMRRRTYGHLHYFTKDLALQSLEGEGYEVLDWFYAPFGIDFPVGAKGKVVRWPRMLLSAISQDFAARLLGGFSLFVLAR